MTQAGVGMPGRSVSSQRLVVGQKPREERVEHGVRAKVLVSPRVLFG